MKQSKHFTFTTPITKGNKNPIPVDITITGIGYFYPSYMGDDGPFDFDIETVEANGQNFTEAYHILESDDDSRLVDLVHAATLAHMEYIFTHLDMPTEAEMKEAHTKVLNGDFSGDNLFKAIGSICMDYNKRIA